MVKFIGEDLDINRAIRLLMPARFKNLPPEQQFQLAATAVVMVAISYLAYPLMQNKIVEPMIGDKVWQSISNTVSFCMAAIAGLLVSHIPQMATVYNRISQKNKLREEIVEMSQTLSPERQEEIKLHLEELRTDKQYNTYRMSQFNHLNRFKEEIGQEVAKVSGLGQKVASAKDTTTSTTNWAETILNRSLTSKSAPAVPF
jgi:hypothetical protein